MAIAGLLPTGPAAPGEHETRHLKLPSYPASLDSTRRPRHIASPRHREESGVVLVSRAYVPCTVRVQAPRQIFAFMVLLAGYGTVSAASA